MTSASPVLFFAKPRQSYPQSVEKQPLPGLVQSGSGVVSDLLDRPLAQVCASGRRDPDGFPDRTTGVISDGNHGVIGRGSLANAANDLWGGNAHELFGADRLEIPDVASYGPSDPITLEVWVKADAWAGRATNLRKNSSFIKEREEVSMTDTTARGAGAASRHEGGGAGAARAAAAHYGRHGAQRHTT